MCVIVFIIALTNWFIRKQVRAIAFSLITRLPCKNAAAIGEATSFGSTNNSKQTIVLIITMTTIITIIIINGCLRVSFKSCDQEAAKLSKFIDERVRNKNNCALVVVGQLRRKRGSETPANKDPQNRPQN